ncbi:MAG: glutamate racemase [Alphaproteobacteria bacterium]
MKPILVFDSGVGGLTVLGEIQKLLPDVSTVFVADTAVFPYGQLAPDVLLARVERVIAAMVARFDPALVVIACNTASTLVLPSLRAKHKIPFVGTVPAIKPAAAATRSGIISVLATPGTVKRDYTADLVRQFAASCDVTLVGSANLASLAEAQLRGEKVRDEDIAREIAPCFVERDGKRTDTIVLACTHYPLLLAAFERLAPWPVIWIDSAPAIARRVKEVLPVGVKSGRPIHRAALTADGPTIKALSSPLTRFGINEIEVIPIT